MTPISPCWLPECPPSRCCPSLTRWIRWATTRWSAGAGATFDACLRFLKEDPWDRLRKLRDGFKHTKLQMLFRGQNILGYNHYADDVVEYFVQKSIANGIDIIRNFRLSERYPQSGDCRCGRQEGEGPCPDRSVLHSWATPTPWTTGEISRRDRGHGRRFPVHQGHGRPSDPLSGAELVKALKGGKPIFPLTCTPTTPPALLP